MRRSVVALCLGLTALAGLAACSESTETREPVSVSNAAVTESTAAATNQGPKPPEEAFTACKGLAEAASCTVAFDGKNIAGTCRKGPDGATALACAPNEPPHGGHRAPPAEVFEACKSLAEGASCNVVFTAKTLSGTCRKGPDASATLACAPSDMRQPPVMGPQGPQGHRGPPPEALEACKALADGASCNVTVPSKTLAGTCRKGPDASAALACAPSDRPDHPQGHFGPPAEALEACKSLTDGASCSLVLPTKSFAGTCRKGPDASADLACAPSDLQPPAMGPQGPQGHRGPPAEAVDACKNLSEGAVCNVQIPERRLEGSCVKGPDGNAQLGCRPTAMPH